MCTMTFPTFLASKPSFLSYGVLPCLECSLLANYLECLLSIAEKDRDGYERRRIATSMAEGRAERTVVKAYFWSNYHSM